MRRSVLVYLRVMRRRGASAEEAARTLGISRETLSRWERERRGAPDRALRLRGRPARRASRTERRAVLEVLSAEGACVGTTSLKERFPTLARRELDELRARYSYALRRRRRPALHALRWTSAGSVWALDFTEVPGHVDEHFDKLLLVRDLASRAELLSLPVYGEQAAEVALGLELLFEVHGAPLVLKEDNGSGCIAESTRRLCARYGVTILYSPPYTPSYNGSREAAGGSLKNRALRIAAAQGRLLEWTSEDVERARQQMNHASRPWGARGATPAQAFAGRRRITQAERAAFLASCRELALEQRLLDRIAPGALLTRQEQAIIDRAAISRALRTHGLLEVRRG